MRGGGVGDGGSIRQGTWLTRSAWRCGGCEAMKRQDKDMDAGTLHVYQVNRTLQPRPSLRIRADGGSFNPFLRTDR